jgi:multicomponent Na+:H+ antiporter subunit G
MTVIAAILMVIGSIFCLVATVGMLRFPDLYTRLHAASKAGPLGAGLILLAAGIASGDVLIFARSLLGLVFLILVGPVSAHLLARAALKSGVPLASITSIDEFRDSSGDDSSRTM